MFHLLTLALVAVVPPTLHSVPRTLKPYEQYRQDYKWPRCQAAPSGSGLLYDGNFQLDPDIGSNYSEYYAGERFARGWRVTSGSIDYNGSTGWGPPAPNNACTVDMDGINPGKIRSDPFQTTPGVMYTLSFIFSGNGGESPQVKKMDVEAAGQSQRFTWNLSQGDAENGNYTTQTWTFTATSTLTVVKFISRDPSSASRGAVIGDMAVTQS